MNWMAALNAIVGALGALGSFGTSAYSAHEQNKGQREANWYNAYIAQQTNETNRQIAAQTNISNAEQARSLMEWQERMAGSQYQRTMADMKAAGINPMLAATLGGGGTPPGASIPATVGAPAQTGAPMQNTRAGGSVLTAGLNSAMEAIRLRADLKNMEETNSKIKSDVVKNKSDTALNKALTFSAVEDANLKSANARIAAINANILKGSLAGSIIEREIDETKYGKTLRYLGRLNPLTSITSSAKNISSVMR